MEVRSIQTIVQALNTAGIKYIIVGGLAVNAHGFVRMTRDIDIVFQLDPANAAKGLEVLLQSGWQLSIPEPASSFADAAKREEWKNLRNMIVLKLWSDDHKRTPIDLFIYEPFDFNQEYSQVLQIEIAAGVTAPVVSLETLLKMKREAGRPQDLIDISELGKLL